MQLKNAPKDKRRGGAAAAAAAAAKAKWQRKQSLKIAKRGAPNRSIMIKKTNKKQQRRRQGRR